MKEENAMVVMTMLGKLRDAAGWLVGGALLGAASGWLLGVNPLIVAASLGVTAAIVKVSFGRNDPCPPERAGSVEELGRNIGAFLRGMENASEHHRVWSAAQQPPDRKRLH
jgi:hypothetical protein